MILVRSGLTTASDVCKRPPDVWRDVGYSQQEQQREQQAFLQCRSEQAVVHATPIPQWLLPWHSESVLTCGGEAALRGSATPDWSLQRVRGADGVEFCRCTMSRVQWV